MANLKSNVFVIRSESLKLTGAHRPSVIMTPRYASANRPSHLPSAKPSGEAAAAARNSSHLRTSSSGEASANVSPRAVTCASNRTDRVPDASSQSRPNSKQPSSQAIRRLTNGGRPVQRRLSLDTTTAAATNRKPILKNRRSSISNGELSDAGSLCSSAQLTFFPSRSSSSFSAYSGRVIASSSAYMPASTNSGGFHQGGGGYTNSDAAAVLKDCSYRLPSFSIPPPESGMKKVSFDDQISVIPK